MKTTLSKQTDFSLSTHLTTLTCKITTTTAPLLTHNSLRMIFLFLFLLSSLFSIPFVFFSESSLFSFSSFIDFASSLTFFYSRKISFWKQKKSNFKSFQRSCCFSSFFLTFLCHFLHNYLSHPQFVNIQFFILFSSMITQSPFFRLN